MTNTRSKDSSSTFGFLKVSFKKFQKFKLCQQGYEWNYQLKFVRIYIDIPAFDEITKDTTAKFVDMLSAIGGTFGLLTGFSIISSVEIVYFFVKFLSSLISRKS